MADKARDDIKDMADKMVTVMAEREKAAATEEKAPPKIGEVTIVPRTAPGWIVRLCVLVLILRWQPLFRLVGRLALMAAK